MTESDEKIQDRIAVDEADEHCFELLGQLITAARNEDKAMYTKTRKIIRGLILEDKNYRRFFHEASKVSFQ